ncbi:TetR family transcriptional regulator C-terminal domain-containing protein [Streptomyces albiflavescens]|nr:TetR family transcriptional regulator C-terminal domain-containing protein [Streptomyces albiflavescens]
MIQVWTEALRNDELSALTTAGYDKARAAWAKLVENYKAAGLMPEDARADAMARTVIALAQGSAARTAVFGASSAVVLRDALRALMGMGESTVRP